ncbi:hypothetical protein EEB15_32675 [Ramlibacter sp. WS9]|nr:hypothetical protein EEB15_32675 [Ramlibacter sp. WS9]
MSRTLTLEYRGQHRFEMRVTHPTLLEGVLVLSEASRAELSKLLDSEDGEWWADSDGRRLPAAGLFAKSPWAVVDGGSVEKVACRYIKLETGDVLFATGASYGA